MSDEQERIVEVILGSASGAAVHLEESARGAAPVHFSAPPKVGPSGTSGASDAVDSAKDE